MLFVFVCSGNTCRSPLALAAWRVLQKRGAAPREVEAQSAGISASSGAPAAKYSMEIAREWGNDLSTHVSRPLSDELAQKATAFFVMSSEHVHTLRECFHIAPEKIHLLGAFAGQEHCEILDPFGGSREAYETCAAQIFRAVEGVAQAAKNGKL
jgi:protein-tyrosine-phosphatase